MKGRLTYGHFLPVPGSLTLFRQGLSRFPIYSGTRDSGEDLGTARSG